MRGKYSPTVTAAYQADQEWFRNYCFHDINGSEWAQYDPEGYDAYGYNDYGYDRAGNQEHEYYNESDADSNFLYSDAMDDWGFDGEKPAFRA